MNTNVEIVRVNQLRSGDYQSFFQGYIDLVGDDNVVEQMREQIGFIRKLFSPITDEVALTVHAPYRWTLKQVVGHLNDVERIFGYRALRIACAEDIPLPGFDQELLVDRADYSQVSIGDLVDEFMFLRESNLLMFGRFTTEMWNQSGLCDNKNISVRALACIMTGHVNHHLQIVRKRLGE